MSSVLWPASACRLSFDSSILVLTTWPAGQQLLPLEMQKSWLPWKRVVVLSKASPWTCGRSLQGTRSFGHSPFFMPVIELWPTRKLVLSSYLVPQIFLEKIQVHFGLSPFLLELKSPNENT